MRTLKLLHYKDKFCVVFPEIERSQVRLPASAPPCNNSGQVVNTHVPLLPTVQFGTDQRMVMLCGREGNCRSGVALAMQPDFSGLSTYGLTAKVREMSTPPTPIRAWSALPLPYHDLTVAVF